MSNAEITKDILVALIGNNSKFYAEKEYAEAIADSFEIIFNKVKELNK